MERKRKLPGTTCQAFPASGGRSLNASARESNAGTSQRRQPQISCDFCRRKKLKCDRGHPCSNCVAREQECSGGPGASSVSRPLDSGDILERLRRLEQAVFAAEGGHVSRPSDTGHLEHDDVQRQPSRHLLHAPCPTDMDYPSVGDAMVSDTSDAFHFRPPDPSHHSLLKRQYRLETSHLPCVLLPSKESALAMFDYFLVVSHCLPQTIHVPSARSTISDFYSRASLGHAPLSSVDTAHAAFILSICAAAVFFWNGDDAEAPLQLFPSVGDAERHVNIWFNAAWKLLDQSSHVNASGTLGEVQACLIMADLLYNREGCSFRYRYLHNRALTVARSISLHLIDAPGRLAVPEEPLTEFKRRVWWHVASTDWLLSIMGGPHDRTYQVLPKHMAVNYPRNVNDEDISAILGDQITTDMSFFIQRIRLAEVCRKVVDFLPIDGCGIERLPFEQILAISQLFSDAMASMPPGFALDGPTSPDSPRSVVMNRYIMHLTYHARIARIFRPFLLLDQQSRSGRAVDSRLSQFRSLCLRSARSVLRIAYDLLNESLGKSTGRAWPRPFMHRSGCVVCHMFMVCIVLATDPNLAADGASSAADGIRAELAGARILLEQVGEKSLMAAKLVERLVSVLKGHALHAVAENQADVVPTSRAITITSASQTTPARPAPTSGSGTTPVADDRVKESRNGRVEQPAPYTQNPLPISQGVMKDLSWDLGESSGGGGDFYPQVLDGIEWAALMGANFTDSNSWSDLFSDLDAAFPASI